MGYRRRLPHWSPPNRTLFVTWRLAGSIPGIPNGPQWLADPTIAKIIQDALLYGSRENRLYDLQAWVIMPNHVHVLWEAQTELAQILHWLKSRTAVRANALLNRTGKPFWHQEYFDRWLRDGEFDRFKTYIEQNPVRAGLISAPKDWPWSSASS